MIRFPSYRGQPLVALLLVIGLWVAARAVLWDAVALEVETPQFAIADESASGGRATGSDTAVSVGDAGGFAAAGPAAESDQALAPAPMDKRAHVVPAVSQAAKSPVVRPGPAQNPASQPRHLARRAITPPYRGFMPPPAQRFAPVPTAGSLPAPQRPVQVPVRVAASHQVLWMAALSQVPLPMAMLSALSPQAAPAPFYPAGREPRAGKRWSADGWLLWRRGSEASLASSAAPASYGASQLGAVLRYRLAPESSHRPAFYLRSTAALNGSREKEAAFGFSARPIARLPVIAAAEMRATSQPGGMHFRPAFMAVTELAPFNLPLGARGEAYGQAGYVGGTYATAFADGQLRVDRKIGMLGGSELRAGGGVWGGAQKGASRLDVGPSATIGLGLGGSSSARLALDWRFRVSGRAAPASGPAVTLSAGF